MTVFTETEAAAALFQAATTFGLSLLFAFLNRRYRKPHFFWWSVAFGLYGAGLVAIVSFLATERWAFLYSHQVIIGWTALALLYAAMVFERELRWRPWFWAAVAFPLAWSYAAIFWLDSFALAAGTTVVFLGATTFWTAWVFWRYRRRTGSSASTFLAVTFALWALHHLDYPILRARGAWNPWGYFLDAIFVLLTGAGVLLLVIEEFRAGLGTLVALSGEVARGRSDGLASLLERPLGLRGVRGAGLFRVTPSGAALAQGSGICQPWSERGVPAPVLETVQKAAAGGTAELIGHRSGAGGVPFLAALPLGDDGDGPMVLAIAGDVAAAFTALDPSVLAAVGGQIGSALRSAALDRALALRQDDLERLSVRMIQQHEEQRRRVGRELHDETAQVFSALKLGLGAVQDEASGEMAAKVERLIGLVDRGNQSIRNVIEDLRPALLNDLGLAPAIRTLAADFRQWSGLAVEVEVEAEATKALTPAAELAVFRAVQEGLANVARHANATRVRLEARRTGERLEVRLLDDGQGIAPADRERLASGPGRSGLFGLRERIEAEGGRVALETSGWGGLALAMEMPVAGR
ncbi:MAG: hypothetical protein FJ206_14785 [Gemmatimonadetes bacterium]|nr:hypothetical protein [Gemmatimonadota bacterium]